MNHPFRYDTRVFVADTNCFGTVYFARYFEWQGRAREAFFRAVLPTFKELMEAGYRLLTVKAVMRYRRELRLFDPLTITLEILELRQTTLLLRFSLFRGEQEPVGAGHQRLVLTDRDGRPVKIPDDVRHRLAPFLIGRSNGVAA
jgi:acyl-CoA thioester hydrolase